MTNQQKLAKLSQILTEVEAYGRAIGKMNFDMECCAPEEGLEQAGEDMAILGKHIHELTHSDEYQQLVCELNADSEGLAPLEKKLVERLYESYEKTKNLSAEFSYEMDMVFNKAYGAWLKAKKNNDFAAFADSLGDVVSYTRKAIDLRDRKYDSYYLACLDDNEKGASIAGMDAFFAALKERIVPLVKRIQQSGKTLREDFLTRPCAIPQQEAFSRYLLEMQGLRKTALVLMTTEHPFTTNFGPKDVRVTTHYFEENFISNIFSTLHEGGHALFMQYEPEEFHKHHVDNGMSNAMHETISRFYENIIGRSEAFIHAVYEKLQQLSGDTFSDVTERELYEAVNIARPSLIRIESDELTYCLHILVRYELEKAMMNGDITIDQVPEMWKRKYKEYLGVDVPSDSEGCLQDVHWTMSMGYFPSYALGNAYGAQILRRMQKDIDVFGQVEKGDLSGILDWLKAHVFSCASVMTPDEWIRHITGEGLNVQYYLDYLEEKYSAIYGL